MATTIKEYWDSCLFISYLEDKYEDRDKVNVIETLLRRAGKPNSNLLIVVSTIVLAEIQYRDQYNQDHYQEIRQLFYTARHFIKVQVLTPRIADETSKLRNQYGSPLALTDAIHLVTATLEGCNIVYTFDGDAFRKRPCDLLSFNGKQIISGYPALNVSVPILPPNSQLPLTSD